MTAIAQALRTWPITFDRMNRVARALGRRTVLYSELAAAIRPKEPFTFLQIGANDGISHDPFREFMIRHNAHGVAVEPVPEFFAEMSRNYAAYAQVLTDNCAVGYPAERIPFYAYQPEYLAAKGGSKELAGLASFTREKLVVSLEPGESPDECIREIMIPVCTVEELMVKCGFEHFDCLFMDCEGHEENILTHLDYDRVQPRLIVYEHTHYGERAERIEAHLSARGFVFTRLSHDTVASR